MITLGMIKWHQVAISLLLGVALGTAFGHWHAEECFRAHFKRGGMKQHILERFNKELRLSAEQKAQVAAIFDAKHPQMVALQDEMKPKFEALQSSAQTEIRKILDPGQQIKFDALNTKMEARWKERQKFFSS